jgi:hypothetical protein
MLFGTAGGGLSALKGQTLFDSVPLRLSGNANDLAVNPPDFTSLDVIADAALNWTGLQGSAKGRWVVIANKGAPTVTLVNLSGASQAQNQFNLNGANIALTQNAVVLLYGTMTAGWLLMAQSLAGAGGGGSSTVGPLVTATLISGENDNLAPAGFSIVAPYTGRLDLILGGGVANVTGLEAGADGQQLVIRNTDLADNVTLNSQNAGSTAANRFSSSADLILTPGNTCLATYYAGSVDRWVLTP